MNVDALTGAQVADKPVCPIVWYGVGDRTAKYECIYAVNAKQNRISIGRDCTRHCAGLALSGALTIGVTGLDADGLAYLCLG